MDQARGTQEWDQTCDIIVAIQRQYMKKPQKSSELNPYRSASKRKAVEIITAKELAKRLTRKRGKQK